MAELRAEMTASVWKVVVADGDRVEAGTELLILESMKMEIPVEASSAGTVTAVHVAEGDQVAEDQLLVTIS